MRDGVPTSDVEREFAAAMRDIYLRAKAEAGYNATYFRFTALWERGRLDLTVEAHVVQDRFATLFTESEREAARYRLAQYGYTPTS